MSYPKCLETTCFKAKATCCIFLAATLSAVLFLSANTAQAASKLPAAPVSALFYPNEILLTVEENITPAFVPDKGKALCITLPQGNVQNFSAIVNGAPATSFYWIENPENEHALTSSLENDPDRKALLLTKETVETELNQKQAAIKTAETRLVLWEQRQPRKEPLAPEEMLKLDAALAEHLPPLFANLSKDKRALELLEKDLEKARDALAIFDNQRRENIMALPFDGPDGKAALVRYTYIIPGSCATTYSITAYPAKNTLRIEQEAALYQTTGQAWKNVEVFISTTRRDTAVRPNSIPLWLIRLHDKNMPLPAAPRAMHDSKMQQMSELTAAEAPMEMEMAAPAPAAPVQSEMGTFRLWSLGKRTIDSDVAVNLPLASEEHKAHYFYTLQPAYNPKGFLTAELNLDKALELPQGKTRLFVDDVSIGEQTMSINGNKAIVYFGSDPQVTAHMRDVQRSKGEQGFISKEQSRLWHWEIAVRNTRGRPVEVWVLDPIPTVQDTAVKLSVESKPKPEETTTARQLGASPVYCWKLTLQPGEAKTIDHKVHLTAPVDKFLSPGRR